MTVAEPWRFASAQRIRPDGSESPARVTFGLPDGATTVRPVVMQGRWLLPGEGNALVATANLLGDEPDLAGRRRGRRCGSGAATRRGRSWASSSRPTMAPFLYVGTPALERSLGDAGRVGIVMVGTDDKIRRRPGARSAAAVREPAGGGGHRRLGDDHSRRTSRSRCSRCSTRSSLFISVMAVVLGVVGGLGLAGTMTMNVVERSREIGVMRAIGASDTAVLLLFLAEGLLIGLLAWLRGRALAPGQPPPLRRARPGLRPAPTRVHDLPAGIPALVHRGVLARHPRQHPPRLAGGPHQRS